MSVTEAPAKATYTADFEQYRQSGPDVAWLATLRQKGIRHFETVGFPSPRQEEWKYTQVAPIQRRHFQLAAANDQGHDPAILQAFLIPALPCHRLVFVDGHYVAELSDTSGLPAGVQVCDLASQLQTEPSALEPYFSDTAALQEADGFRALNTAFLGNGSSIRLAKGVILEQPLHLLYLSSGEAPAQVTHPRNLIVLGEQAQATIIEHYAGLGANPYLQNVVSEAHIAQGAQLSHYRLQQENAKAYHIATMNVVQQRDSRFLSHVHTLSGALTRNELTISLAGEGAECTLYGLYVAKGREHIDNHTRVDHAKPQGRSEEVYRGVLDERSRGVFSGKVMVHKDAQKTEAHQSNRNLLLHRNAEVDTKPQLEIYADDVKCSHGATVGQLDADEIFYLRSRGISEAEARRMLVFAFANEIIQHIAIAPLADYLHTRLEAKLTQNPAKKT